MLLATREDLQVALQTSEEALELCDEVGDPLGEIASRHLVHSVYLRQGRPEDALRTMRTALQLARELRDRRQIGQALEAIVNMHASAEEPEKVLAVLQEEVDLARRFDDPRRLLAALQRTAHAHIAAAGGEARAVELAEEAVKLKGAQGDDRRLEGWALQLLAEAHGACKRHDDALGELAQARSVLLAENDIRSVVDTWQSEFNMRMEMEDEAGALNARAAQHKTYADAGWLDEAAQALLFKRDKALHSCPPRAR
jgi:tetratricopeptide (TPR) repeat protein